MRYITDRDTNLVNKLHRLLADAARKCPDAKVATMKENFITYINEEITEYVMVWFFDGRQICVHRAINEGVQKFGRDIIRVWERNLPNDEAIDKLGTDIHRMLGQRLRVQREVEEFKRFALEFAAEGMIR